MKSIFCKVREKEEREMRSFIIICVFAFVKQFMKHSTKLRLIVRSSELPYNLRFAENKIVPHHTFTGDERIRFRTNNQKYHKSSRETALRHVKGETISWTNKGDVRAFPIVINT